MGSFAKVVAGIGGVSKGIGELGKGIGECRREGEGEKESEQ